MTKKPDAERRGVLLMSLHDLMPLGPAPGERDGHGAGRKAAHTVLLEELSVGPSSRFLVGGGQTTVIIGY